MNKFIELAKSKGIEDIQINSHISNSLSIEIFDKKIEQCKKSVSRSWDFKAIYFGKVCNFFTNVFEESDYEFVIQQLIDNANGLTLSEPVFIYEGDKDYETVPEPDYDFDKIDLGTKINLAKKLELVLEENNLVHKVNTIYSEKISKTMIVIQKD